MTVVRVECFVAAVLVVFGLRILGQCVILPSGCLVLIVVCSSWGCLAEGLMCSTSVETPSKTLGQTLERYQKVLSRKSPKSQNHQKEHQTIKITMVSKKHQNPKPINPSFRPHSPSSRQEAVRFFTRAFVWRQGSGRVAYKR